MYRLIYFLKMTRLIFAIIIALIGYAAGIFFFIKKKKTQGLMFLTLAFEFTGCAVAVIRYSGVSENICVLFFHGIATLTALAFALILKHKYKVRFPGPVKKILIIVPSCIAILVAFVFATHKTSLYRKMAENLKPITRKDKVSRSLYVNCFYKSKIPGYTYSEPQEIKYFSKVTNMERSAMVILPESYDGSKKYPVLYLLHGLGGSDITWINKKADIIVKNMHYLYDCPEMVVVMPDCNVNEENSTAGMSYSDKCKYFDRTEEEILGSLMPYINENFEVYTDKAHTAIAGNSMGGRNSLAISYHHQDMFDYVGVFSSASVLNGAYSYFTPLIDDLKLNDKDGGFKTLLVMVGREDYVCGNVSYDLHKQLNEAGVKHIFYDVFGLHHNPVWQNGLYNFMIDIRDKMPE